MANRIKARLAAIFDRRYVRRADHQAETAQLTNRIEQLTNRVEQLTNRVEQLTNRNAQLASRIAALEAAGRRNASPENTPRAAITDSNRPRPTAEIATDTARSVETLLQNELRLWRELDALTQTVADLADDVHATPSTTVAPNDVQHHHRKL